MKQNAIAAALIGTAAFLSSCAANFSPPPVPPPQAEMIPKPPVTAEVLIWQPGHWNWNGSSYVWQPGEFVPRGGHGDLFQPGYWAQTRSGWVWQPAHWM